MVKKGPTGMFDMGEIDMKFGQNNLTVTYPNRTRDIYDVWTSGPSKFHLSKDGKNYTVTYQTLKSLKHTTAMGLSTYGEEAPNSFKEGMDSNRAESLVMWKCNSWATK